MDIVVGRGEGWRRCNEEKEEEEEGWGPRQGVGLYVEANVWESIHSTAVC